MKINKVCIVGCGAIGTWLGVRLSKANEITLSCLVRERSLADIKTHGLRLDEGGHTLQAHPQFASDAQMLGPQDLVILAIKSTSLLETVSQLAPLIAENTCIWTAMNGVPWWFTQGLSHKVAGRRFKCLDPEGVIEKSIPLKHWLGGVVHASSTLKSAGYAWHHFGQTLILGEPEAPQSHEASQRTQALNQILLNAGFDARISQNIQADIWYKLWGNMTMNPISALTGATTQEILQDTYLKDFATRVMLEAQSIGEQIGLPIHQTPEDRHAITQKLGAIKTSMLQDLENHRPLELDALLGAVLELSQWCNVPAPFTQALMALTRVKGRTMGLYH